MRKLLLSAGFLMMSLAIIQCSDDGNGGTNGTLFVNGEEFKLGTNGGEESTFNSIIVLDGHPVKTFNVAENIDSIDEFRTLLISVNNENNPASLSGTYTMDIMDIMENGNASVSIEFANGESVGDLTATGTVTVQDMESDKYRITFNDVILDEGTENETTVTGYVEKNFEEFGF